MGLQRRRTRKPLVAHLAFVLLLGVGRHLGTELAHHGLGSRRRTACQQSRGTRKGTRGNAILIGFRGSGAVIGHGRVHRGYRRAVVGVIAAGGNGRPGGMGRGEAIRVSRASGIARTINVPGSQVLAESHHATAGVQRITKSRSGRGLRLTNTGVAERSYCQFLRVLSNYEHGDIRECLRMGYPAVLRVVQRRSITQRRITCRSKAAHGGSGGIGRRVVEGGARHLMLHTHHFGGRIARGGGSGGSSRSRTRVVAARDQGRCRDGNTGVGHGHGRGSVGDFFLLDGIEAQGRGGIDGRVGVRGRVCSGPGISELWRIVMRQATMRVDVVETHSAILAVLVLHDHSHWE